MIKASEPTILSLYQGKAFDNFKDSLKTEVTQLGYTNSLKRFLTYNKLTSPQELLTIPTDTLEDMIKNHTIYLQKEIKSPSQAMNFQSALKHFCRMNKKGSIGIYFMNSKARKNQQNTGRTGMMLIHMNRLTKSCRFVI